MSHILIAGGDEAGRGAVIGPIVISVVSISKGRESRLSRIGVRDSKMLTRRMRNYLFDEIYSAAEEVKVYKISASEINESMKNKISINELEAINFARLIDSLKKEPRKVFLDSPDVISERFGLRVRLFSKKQLLVAGMRRQAAANSIRVIAEHKADARYPIVSSASIIAKVVRDGEIARIRKRENIEIGSGYPSDRITVEAIRRSLGSGRLSPYLREHWKTLKTIRQLKMDDFLGEAKPASGAYG